MNTKLTLRLDENIIKKIKEYSKETKTSISKLTENFYKSIVNEEKKVTQPEIMITPNVKKLIGIITFPEQNEKDIISDYLIEKHQ